MHTKFKSTTALILSLLIVFSLASCAKTTDDASADASPTQTEGVTAELPALADFISAYTDAVDAEWAYNLAVEIIESGEYADNRLGDRQSGSDAEHRTAEKIAEVMKDIGLSDVTLDPVIVDRIQAGDSGLTLDGSDREIILHAYQTNGTPAGGLTGEIIDAGSGTAADYEGLDVSGKVVLIDIDQRADWWIGIPVMQAIEKGAAAVIANNVAGFSEISDDAYNANDFCGPATIPTASITRNDAAFLRENMTDGVAVGTLVVDNEYSKGGTTYNVTGTIKGRDSSEAILFGAHYDAYYESFQDDTIAWTGMLAIAKAMRDSGYVPERDITFVAHGAEEWGESDTSYDWALGSYRQITEAHADWQGKIISFINFELPAYAFSSYTYTQSAPESYGLVQKYTESEYAAKPEGAYPDGILTDGFQTYTYSDDFSYYVSGVPSFINGMLLDLKNGSDAFDFYYKYYHTNYDTKETYNEAVFDWQLKFYGGLGIFIDNTPAVELDFGYQAERLRDSFNEETAALYADGGAEFTAAVDKYAAAASTLTAKIDDVNARYLAATTADERTAIMAEGKELNRKTLAIFKSTQDALLAVSAETPIVPHEWYQSNLELIGETVAYLEAGDVQSAVDETAWAINGIAEWYPMFFDEATVAHIRGAYAGEFAPLNWAQGKTLPLADVQAATRLITARYEESGGDFSDEIAIYVTAITEQAELYAELLVSEAAAINALAEDMTF
ncbi:MAG: M28 family peptidase [Oscillospiraceae bacterium]|jgi:Iap family predicted aminopeptidase|nr:M28 family peptidase [Oscillospiraceae bacterium]